MKEDQVIKGGTLMDNFLHTPKLDNLNAFIKPDIVEKSQISKLETTISLRDKTIIRLQKSLSSLEGII